MKRLTLLFALLCALIASLAVGLTTASPAAAAPANGGVTAPSTLPIVGTVAGGGTFTGTLSNLQFVNQNGALAVTGDLTGTLTNAAGTVLGTVTNVPVTLPIAAAAPTGSCQILDLTLGPLDLDLLGLQVHLDTVHLNITAQRGPGNLLGNLLCAVAHLLDGGGGGGLANLLNTLLGL
jgi:hypothetical protein